MFVYLEGRSVLNLEFSNVLPPKKIQSNCLRFRSKWNNATILVRERATRAIDFDV